MSQTWTVQQVMDLAPDASSQKAGQGLAKAGKWSLLEGDGKALWGEIKGSGKKPYQTRIDLGEPAFKCSCPSRKFPCKHALGLFLIHAESPKAFRAGTPPDWVADWLSGRAGRAAKKAERAEKKRETAADPAAQAKRVAAREKKIAAGLDELQTWLADLLRRGLATARAEPFSLWENMAARLVDAQAPGLARLVRQLGEVSMSGPGWDSRLLAAIGRLHLLIEGYRRIERADDELQAELRAAVGWTVGQDELAALPGVKDTWLVLGQQVEEEDRLRAQRTWLWGLETGRPALVLHFAAGTQPLDASLVVGTKFAAELVYYPGAAGLRAMVRERTGAAEANAVLPAPATIAEALALYGRALARVPWLERWPLAVGELQPDVTLSPEGEAWLLRDAAGAVLPLEPRFAQGWELLAVSGGHPIAVFGEWSGEALLPLSAAAEARFFAVGKRADQPTLARVA